MPAEADLAIWGSDLGLFYSGLFNFYQFAAFEVKRQFLNFIQDYVLKLKRELLLSLPGFLLCMLPALEDQNSDLLKQVEAILTETEKIVGTSKFFGETWKALLRTPRCRLSAMKFLDRRIPKNPAAAVKLVENQRVILSPYHYEIKLGNVVLADHSESVPEWYHIEMEMLVQLQQNESLEAYFYFYYPNKSTLVNNALLAGLSIVSQDVYVNRATFDFLLSHMPITSQINNYDESVNIVEGALMTLVKKDFASLKKFFTWFQGHFEEDADLVIEQDPSIRFVVPALKLILQKFHYVDLDQKVKINEMGIQERNLWTINTPIQILINLLSDNMPIAKPILFQISVDLLAYIRNYYQQDQIDFQNLDKFKSYVTNLFQMLSSEIGCLWTALGSLLEQEIQSIKLDHVKIVSIDLIAFMLRELQPAISEVNIDETNVKQPQNDQLAQMLIPIVSGLLSGVEKLSQNELEQPALDLIDLIFKKIDRNIFLGSALQESVNQFNSFYIKLSLKATTHFRYSTYKRSSQIMYKIQKYADPLTLTQMPQWLLTVIQCSSDRKRGTKLLLVSMEAFINILESSSDHSNLKSLQALISPKRNTCCMEIVQTLWSLLDEAEDHEKIVQLLKKFDKLCPKIFSEVVTRELNAKQRDVKHRAVKKFSIFWKLTTVDYPEYKPFQPLIERLREHQHANKQISHELKLAAFYAEETADTERSYVALHNMLHLLEDQDPTMRLSCRSWLSESKQAYIRIIDPLLSEFIDNNKVFVSFSGQLFFLEGYDTQVIIENFGKLRNVILNTQDELVKYIVTTKLSGFIQMILQKDSKFVKGKDTIHSDGKYIQTIVQITLQFIMGQAVESLNQKLFQESQTVNASAAEFMELILKSVQPYKELAQEICHMIIMPVVRTLRQSIANGNVAQQVHLLNLLKVILFECNFYSASSARKDSQAIAHAQNAKEIFTDLFLLNCICDGMKNEQSFVRNAFIQFSIKLVPYMRDIIDAKVMATHSTVLLDTFCQLLLMTDVSQYQIPSNFLNLTNSQSKKRLKFVINQEADIVVVVAGLKNLVNNCLGIVDNQETVQDTEIERQLEDLGKTNLSQENSSYGFFNWYKSKPDQGPQDPNQQIKEAIFLQMQNIILSCLNIWNDMDLYRVRNYYFTRMGVFAYHKEDDKKMDQQITGRSDQDKLNKTAMLTQANVDQDTYIKSNLNLIQSSVVALLEPVNAKYSFYLIKGFLEIWKTSSSLVGIGINVNQGCEKIIQILVSLQIDPHDVIDAVNKWIAFKKYDTIKEKRTVELGQEQKEKATLQSLVCQFVYMYLLHSVQHQFKMQRQKHQSLSIEQKQAQCQEQYSKLYQNMQKFIKHFVYTKHPNTISWLMELLYILTNRFKPDDSKLEKKLKLELNEVFELLMRASSSIITDSFGVMYTEKYGLDSMCYSPCVYELIKRYQFVKQKSQINEGIEQARKPNVYLVFDQVQLQSADQISVHKDSIFNDFEQLKSSENMESTDQMSEFLKKLNRQLNDGSLTTHPLLQQEFYKCFTVLTLRQILVRLTMNIFNTEETDKINFSLQIIVAAVMKILDNHVKVIATIKDAEAKRQSEVQAEFLTDFLAGLATENQILQKLYKQEITAMFNSDNFFLMSERTLRKWQQIMRNFMSVNNEVFEELLLKFNRVEGIFVSKKWELYQKSLTFKRLAFLVYSSQTNSFEENQLDTLLKKMTEGFKNTTKDRELTIQLFLLSRILMLRLSMQALAEVLRKLWPHLLNELVNVFDVSSEPDYLLQIEGMKVVELMSQLNIEDFHMNQWMFLFDGYGMQVNQAANEILIDTQGPKVFQPFLVKFMCNKSDKGDGGFERQIYSFYQGQDKQLLSNKPSGPNPSQFRKTAYSGQGINLDDKQALQREAFRFAQELQQLLTSANLERTEIDRESAEALIEKDFLTKPRYHE